MLFTPLTVFLALCFLGFIAAWTAAVDKSDQLPPYIQIPPEIVASLHDRIGCPPEFSPWLRRLPMEIRNAEHAWRLLRILFPEYVPRISGRGETVRCFLFCVDSSTNRPAPFQTVIVAPRRGRYLWVIRLDQS